MGPHLQSLWVCVAVHRGRAVGRHWGMHVGLVQPSTHHTHLALGSPVACGIGMLYLARILFDNFPEVFLPLYKPMKAQYQDLQANPNLRRLINDNRAAIMHLGFYLGFLLYEVIRRDWKNVKLILTVGLVNGLGWAVCQNWKWAPGIWPHVHFNWWRCWESSGGISIGVAYGLAYYLVNCRSPERRGRHDWSMLARISSDWAPILACSWVWACRSETD